MKVKDIYMSILNKADEHLEQILSYQIIDEGRPDFGGMFVDSEGYATASHVGTAEFFESLGVCYYSKGSRYYLDKDIENRMMYALSFIKSQIRSSGFIDLPFNNYDSPPDTAFMLNKLLSIAYMSKQSKNNGLDKIYKTLYDIMVVCANSVANGGFHTPNHRWVICSALSQVMELEPDNCDYTECIEKYFAEGIDFDDDGFYSERSFGVYDLILNYCFLVLGESYVGNQFTRKAFTDIVEKNLNTRLDFMDWDGTMDTSFSTRQDYGGKYYLGSVTPYLYFAIKNKNTEFAAAAMKGLDSNCDCNAFLYFCARHPEWLNERIEHGKIRSSCELFSEGADLWHVKDEKLSMTLKKGSTNFLRLKYGKTTMAGMRITFSYFNGSRYVVDKIERLDEGVKLYFKSLYYLKEHPAYWMPLGRKVEWSELPYNNLHERDLKKRPEFDVVMDVIKDKNGLDLIIKSDKGMPGVKFCAEFLFVAEGVVETDDVSFQVKKDETMFLKNGWAMLNNERDYIRVLGGNYSHRSLVMNEGTNGLFRIVITDFSPVDKKIRLEFGETSEMFGKCFCEKAYIKD